MNNEENPYSPPTSETVPKQKEEVNPYWGGTTLLDHYSNLGVRGKLRFVAFLFLLMNGVSYFFGFYWPKLLIAGIVALVVSLLLPESMDD